jgi:hypothetical protein
MNLLKLQTTTPSRANQHKMKEKQALQNEINEILNDIIVRYKGRDAMSVLWVIGN